MATISTEQTFEEKRIRKQKLEELKNAANDWLSYNRKILKAEVSFLKKIKYKRTNSQLDNNNADAIRPFYLKSLSDFLGG